MCCCDGPMPAIYEAKIVKAGKNWRCCECLDDIPHGDRHEHAKGLWEGRWSQFRTCLACVEARHLAYESCIAHGQLMDHLDARDGPEQAAWFERRDATYWRLRADRLRTSNPEPVREDTTNSTTEEDPTK